MRGLIDDLRRASDPCATFETAVGNPAEPWQVGVLSSRARRQVLLAARQSGKSSTIASKVAHRVRYRRDQLVLVFSPSQRQSDEQLARIRTVLRRLGPVEGNASELRLSNGSRVVSLPGSSESTIRGFSAVDLLVYDEAAYVAENIFTASLPMLSGRGQLVLLSTPGPRQGFLWDVWNSTDPTWRWEKTKVRAVDSAQWPADRIADMRRSLSPREAAVELDCEFAGSADSVFDPVRVEAMFVPAAAIRLDVW